VEKMVRVFYNLAGNAADAMKDGGTLTIRTAKQAGGLMIEFGDTGCGIPDEIRSKILEPFFTYGKRHGTGLGLAIVKKIVDDHHGTLQIESVVNEGTTIRLIIPLS
jgi:signal transduction histidine kinase